jgi:enoyl-CoA hydratase/carnithine racemase
MSGLFTLAVRGSRATITLDRPARHNVLEGADLARLEELLEQVEGSPELRVLVLTGAGAKTFCAGFDINRIAETDWRERPLERVLDRLEDLSIPTVCALNGSAYGGGADLALACDLRIGRRGIEVRVPPARLGVHYHVGGLRRFVERLGLGAAKRLILACDTVGDEALLEIGYLDYLVEPDELASRASALAETLAGLAPLAVQAMKRTLNEIARGSLDGARAEAAMLACLASADAGEGARAFAEKRAPEFSGE